MTERGHNPDPDGEAVRWGEGMTAGAGSSVPAWFWSVRDRTLEDELSRQARALLAQGAGTSLLAAGAGGQSVT